MRSFASVVSPVADFLVGSEADLLVRAAPYQRCSLRNGLSV